MFALPDEMYPLFKESIEYLTSAAVNADRRRYATKFEGFRHYIDLDHYSKELWSSFPSSLDSAIVQFGEIHLLYDNADTAHIKITTDLVSENEELLSALYKKRFAYWDGPIWVLTNSEIVGLEPDTAHVVGAVFQDHFTYYGILPYNLVQQQKYLTKAFVNEDKEKILRYAADIGHYIGDAHVPLHTTKNYNGQLTDQIGIHAFWESKIPELLADETFDYLVEKASYIDDEESYYWDIIFESNNQVDSVLAIERRLSKQFPKDRQYCYIDRNGVNVLQECPEYIEAYNRELRGSVEDRFREAVHAVASIWYTSWVDAGRPDLAKLGEEEVVAVDSISSVLEPGTSGVRSHE